MCARTLGGADTRSEGPQDLEGLPSRVLEKGRTEEEAFQARKDWAVRGGAVGRARVDTGLAVIGRAV